jgi:hypothetical protein
VLRYTNGSISAEDLHKEILRKNSYQHIMPNGSSVKTQMYAACRDMFLASDPSKTKGQPLGQLAENLVLFYTGHEDFELGFNLVQSDPILNV